MNIPAIEIAVAKAGSTSAMARAMGVSHTAVRKWRRFGRPPAERVLAIEAITGISRYELRPDVFGPAPDAPDQRVA